MHQTNVLTSGILLDSSIFQVASLPQHAHLFAEVSVVERIDLIDPIIVAISLILTHALTFSTVTSRVKIKTTIKFLLIAVMPTAQKVKY